MRVIDAYNKALALIDEYTEDGVTVDPSDTIDYLSKSVLLADQAQNELAKNGELYGEYNISQRPLTNVLSTNFDSYEHEADEDKTFEYNDKAYAYSFEVDGDATVYIEEYDGGWNVLDTLSITVDNYELYNGVITPSTNATKTRIRFSGSYYYKIRYVALFNKSVPSDRVPEYRPYVRYTLPDSFIEISKVVDESGRTYHQSNVFSWEGRKTILINYNFDGSIKIFYKKIPTTLTSTDDEFEINPYDQNAIPYYLAGNFISVANDTLANFFLTRYQEFLRDSERPLKETQGAIEDIYGVM